LSYGREGLGCRAQNNPSTALSYVESAIEIRPDFVPALTLREEILKSAKAPLGGKGWR
jgi:hypothetical protein